MKLYHPGDKRWSMFILVNLKAYPCDPIEVATAARDVAEDAGVRIAVSPQAAHLKSVADTGVETWAQHVSPNGYGSFTGSTLAEAVAEAGAEGTLLNHSENRRKLADIDAAVRAAERAGWKPVSVRTTRIRSPPPPRSNLIRSPSSRRSSSAAMCRSPRPIRISSPTLSPPPAALTRTSMSTVARGSQPVTT